jgi:Acyl-CoA carboxylase epsilon subunit
VSEHASEPSDTVSEHASEPSNTVSERANEPSNTVSERANEPSNTVSERANGERRPLLRVVRGSPSDEELAALTAVVLAVAARGGETRSSVARPSAWSEKSALMRRTPYPGPGAWRASALPR